MGDLIAAVWRRRRLVVSMVLVAVAVAATASFLMPTTYAARVTMRLATPGSISGEVVRPDAVEYLDRLQNTYVGLATSGALRTDLVKKLNLSSRPDVSLTPRPASELMVLTVRSRDRRQVTTAANTLANMLIDQVSQIDAASLATLSDTFNASIQQLLQDLASASEEREALNKLAKPTDAQRARVDVLDKDIEMKSAAVQARQTEYDNQRRALLGRSSLLSVVTPATEPAPARRGPVTTAAMAGALALAAAVALVAILERRRGRGDAVKPIEGAASAPVLARIAPVSSTGPAVGDDHGLDAFRRLRTELLVQFEREPVRTVQVVTPGQPDDTSYVTVNLGAAMATAGHSVLIVDGDVRSPSLHTFFGPQIDRRGLADVLQGTTSVESAVSPTRIPRLSILPGGTRSAATADLLTPGRITKLVAELEEGYEMVFIRVPPLLESPDALVYSALVSDALLVVAADETSVEDVESVAAKCSQVGASIRGVVVTRSDPKVAR